MTTMTMPPDRQTLKIPMEEINHRVYNIRGPVNPQTCIDLARRIKTEGLNNPVEVVPINVEDRHENDGKPYRLFAGFRRYMAHRINGATHIEAKIYEGLTLEEQAARNFTENVARANLTLMQEARGLSYLKSLRSLNLKELGEEVGMSPKWCQLRLWALELEPEIQQDIDAGLLKTQHIEQIHALPQGEKRYEYVKQVKSAALRGEKPRKSLAKKNVFAKKVRSRTEIFELQDHIIDQLGQGSVMKLPGEVRNIVQALGWCAGEANDIEIFSTLRKLAEANGLHYAMPESALDTLRG